ncbi:hypothetical protein GOODEAATRI_028928 [Goodea atripinnis]|uniref:Uncharacterized protein n=1 Tax=Goodea atripinnis TaxID=208336 RepID=A0ABV0MPK5_9TELE
MDPAFASACAPASVGQPSPSPSADQPSSLLSSPGQPSSLLLSCQGSSSSRTTLPSSSVGLSLPRVPLWVQVLYAWRQFFWTFLKGIWDHLLSSLVHFSTSLSIYCLWFSLFVTCSYRLLPAPCPFAPARFPCNFFFLLLKRSS